MNQDLENLTISESSTLQDAITTIDVRGYGLVMVVDATGRLVGTISDGDIRRAIIAGLSISTSVQEVLKRKQGTKHPVPVTARAGTTAEELKVLMLAHTFRQIPLLDDEDRVVGLALLEELVPEEPLPVRALVLAGDHGIKLHPHQEELPKPLLPVGNQPLFELMLGHLKRSGIQQVHMSTHYKSKKIVDRFGDGSAFGVRLSYLEEGEPLGSAGSLLLIPETDEPILVLNGDILTKVDFKIMLDYHKEHKADMTIAVKSRDFQIAYDVIKTNGIFVDSFEKQPVAQHFINAGIYLFNPDIRRMIPTNSKYDIDELIAKLKEAGKTIVCFPIREYWQDIGQLEGYKQALNDARCGMFDDLSPITQFEAGVPPPPGIIPLCVPEMAGNEWTYIRECLDTNFVSSVGPFVDSFENGLASYIGVKRAVATVNGTAALHIALLVAGVQPDDEVLVSTLTFIAPVNAIRYVGAWPVFIDAEPVSWQMDPDKVKRFLAEDCIFREGKITNKKTGRRIKAIVPVHLLGHPVNMDPIIESARKYNLVVIEDASEGLGAKYKGKKLGGLADIACFSFNGNKIVTTGGGGMIVTDNEAWAARAKYLSTQAKDDPVEYFHKEIGYNYRLTNVQAALGCAQMEKLDSYVAKKRNIAKRYLEELSDMPGITPLREPANSDGTYWLFSVLVDQARFGLHRKELFARLDQAGIQTRPVWQPIHLSPAHADGVMTNCSVAESLYADALSLPCSVGLSSEDQKKIIATIRALCKN